MDHGPTSYVALHWVVWPLFPRGQVNSSRSLMPRTPGNCGGPGSEYKSFTHKYGQLPDSPVDHCPCKKNPSVHFPHLLKFSRTQVTGCSHLLSFFLSPHFIRRKQFQHILSFFSYRQFWRVKACQEGRRRAFFVVGRPRCIGRLTLAPP